MSAPTLESLRADFEAALNARASMLNAKTAGFLLANSLEEHAETPFSSGQNGYADAANAVIIAAQKLLDAQKREELIELANRYDVPESDKHAFEMRLMLLKIADELKDKEAEGED